MYMDALEEFEADLASVPPINVDLYHARAVIRGRKMAILRAALAAARRIARRYGVMALRHEAYQRAALRQGFYSVYMSVHPMPRDPAKRAVYRRELISVGRRAEAELMAMFGSFRSMVLRMAFKFATKGLGESDGMSSRVRNRYRSTQMRQRAMMARRRYAQNRARMRSRARPRPRVNRPGKADIVRFIRIVPRPPASLDPTGKFREYLRLSMWRNWARIAPIAVRMAAAMSRSPTGNPTPALFATIATQGLLRRRLISRRDQGVYFKFFNQLWRTPAPVHVKLAAAGAVVLMLSFRKSASREANFETAPMFSAPPLSGASHYSSASAEAEALARLEAAAL